MIASSPVDRPRDQRRLVADLGRSLLGLVVIAVTLALPPALAVDALAADRFAAPATTGTGDCSSRANACRLDIAIGSAAGGDDVYVPGNLGDYSLAAAIVPAVSVKVHGTDGRPRLLFASGGLRLKSGTAENLYVQGASAATTFALDSASATATNVIAKNQGGGNACYLDDATLTGSVCWAAETAFIALASDGIALESDGAITLRNVTAYATGAATQAGILAFGRSGRDGVVNLVNVIARGGLTGGDLNGQSDGVQSVTFNLDHSSWLTRVTGGGTPDKFVFADQGGNVSAAPLLVAPGSGDFHQAQGSPTIDRGRADAANGTTDLDGQPRTMGATTDIGADEFEPPPATPEPVVPPTVPGTPAATKPLPSFASVVTLPSTKKCVSRRVFRIRLRVPKGIAVTSAEVRVNGKRVKTVKRARITAPVDLRNLPKGRFTVNVRIKLGDGRTISGTRKYRTCTAKTKTKTAPKVY